MPNSRNYRFSGAQLYAVQCIARGQNGFAMHKFTESSLIRLGIIEIGKPLHYRLTVRGIELARLIEDNQAHR